MTSEHSYTTVELIPFLRVYKFSERARKIKLLSQQIRSVNYLKIYILLIITVIIVEDVFFKT